MMNKELVGHRVQRRNGDPTTVEGTITAVRPWDPWELALSSPGTECNVSWDDETTSWHLSTDLTPAKEQTSGRVI